MQFSNTYTNKDKRVKRLNQHDRASIASRCVDHGASRWTVAREYGISRETVDDLCDTEMFRRGQRAERIASKFRPPMDLAFRG